MEEEFKKEKNKELESFLEYLNYQKKYSAYTLLSYQNDICEFLDFLEREGLSFRNLEYSDIRFFLMYLKDEKKDHNSSIDRKLSALRSFYKYLSNEKIVSTNVFSLVSGGDVFYS